MKRPGMQNWMDCFKKKLFGSKWGWGGALAGGNSGAQWTPSVAPPQDRDAEKSPPFCLLSPAAQGSDITTHVQRRKQNKPSIPAPQERAASSQTPWLAHQFLALNCAFLQHPTHLPVSHFH